MASEVLLCVLWAHPPGPNAGQRFWGCHASEHDARIRDWQQPPLNLVPLGAATVTVVEGEGLNLVGPERRGGGE